MSEASILEHHGGATCVAWWVVFHQSEGKYSSGLFAPNLDKLSLTGNEPPTFHLEAFGLEGMGLVKVTQGLHSQHFGSSCVPHLDGVVPTAADARPTCHLHLEHIILVSTDGLTDTFSVVPNGQVTGTSSKDCLVVRVVDTAKSTEGILDRSDDLSGT